MFSLTRNILPEGHGLQLLLESSDGRILVGPGHDEDAVSVSKNRSPFTVHFYLIDYDRDYIFQIRREGG